MLRDGTRLLGVHASPQSDDGPGITPAIADRELAALLAGVDDDVICAGHTHQATDRRLGATRAINLGSISNPITSDLRACRTSSWTTTLVGTTSGTGAVDYDHDAVVARIRGRAIPRRSTW